MNFFLIDYDECLNDNGGCTDTCTNLVGSYTCSCLTPGYTLSRDNKTCVDLDECSTTSGHNCTASQTCVNTMGSHLCMRSMSMIEGIIVCWITHEQPLLSFFCTDFICITIDVTLLAAWAVSLFEQVP